MNEFNIFLTCVDLHCLFKFIESLFQLDLHQGLITNPQLFYLRFFLYSFINSFKEPQVFDQLRAGGTIMFYDVDTILQKHSGKERDAKGGFYGSQGQARSNKGSNPMKEKSESSIVLRPWESQGHSRKILRTPLML
jgi:hypothetical protein